jgi:hypothetical protein
MIAELQKGYRIRTLTEQDADGVKSSFSSETEVSSGMLSFRLYPAGVTELKPENASSFETYYQDSEKGRVLVKRLGADNVLHSSPLYNGKTGTYFSFTDDGYENAFLSLSLSSFTEKQKGIYSLSVASLPTKTLSAFSTQLYGNPGFTLSSLDLLTDSNGLSGMKAVFAPFVSGTQHYDFSFSSVFTSIGEKKAEEAYSPYPEVTDTSFSAMLTALSEKNYTLTQKDYQDDKLVYTSTLLTEPDHLFYETHDEDGNPLAVGYYVDAEKKIQEVEKSGTAYVKKDSAAEGTLDLYRPAFALSPSCFEKKDSLYVLKAKVTDEITPVTVFDALADTLADFTLSIGKDSYLFTNVQGKKKTEVLFTAVGSTAVPFAIKDVQDAVQLSTWKALLSATDYTKLLTFLTEADATALPIPAGLTGADTWKDFSEETTAMILAYSSETEKSADADLTAYGTALTAAGYAKAAASGENGGTVYTKKTSDALKTISLEILLDGTVFTIVITNPTA